VLQYSKARRPILADQKAHGVPTDVSWTVKLPCAARVPPSRRHVSSLVYAQGLAGLGTARADEADHRRGRAPPRLTT